MHPDARGGDSRTGWGFELVWVVERRGKFKRVGRFRRWRCFGGVKRAAKPISSVTETLGSRGGDRGRSISVVPVWVEARKLVRGNRVKARLCRGGREPWRTRKPRRAMRSGRSKQPVPWWQTRVWSKALKARGARRAADRARWTPRNRKVGGKRSERKDVSTTRGQRRRRRRTAAPEEQSSRGQNPTRGSSMQ
jgi:hypothetical protein